MKPQSQTILRCQIKHSGNGHSCHSLCRQIIRCLLDRKYLRAMCGAIYVMPSSYIIINYKLCEYLGAKNDLMFMAAKKAPSYTNKTLGKPDLDFKIEKQSLSVIVHRRVNHQNPLDSLFTPARRQYEKKSTHVVSAFRLQRIDWISKI